jgi:hypothetical protein
LKPVIEALGGPVVLAITATAAPAVRQEIIEGLGMEEPAVIVRGFDRPNIHLAVRPVHGRRAKRATATTARTARPPVKLLTPFAPGDHVLHATLGEGQVLRSSVERLAVLFEESGYRTLDVGMVVEGEVLERVDDKDGDSTV